MPVELVDDVPSRSRDSRVLWVAWIGGAITLHAFVIVASQFAPPRSHAAFDAHPADATEYTIETTAEIPVDPATQTAPEAQPASTSTRRDDLARNALAAVSTSGHPGSEGSGNDAVLTAPQASAGQKADDGSTWSMPVTTAPKDLGVGLDKSAFTNGFITRSSEIPPLAGPSSPVNRSLRQASLDHDVAIGMARGGAVLAAAHDAVSRSLVPDESYALIEVRFDSTGHATSARIVQNQNDRQSWDEAAVAIMKELEGHTARVPEGAAGLSVFVRVEVALKLPSGASSGVSVGGGVFGLTGDLSDIGQGKRRVVAQRIVSESVF